MKVFQPRTNTVNDEGGHLFTDFQIILVRWRNHFSHLLNVYRVNDISQIDVHTAEPLVHDPSAYEFGLTIEKLKSYKTPHINQITAELIKAAGRTIHSDTPKLINSIWNKEELPEEWKESIPYLSI